MGYIILFNTKKKEGDSMKNNLTKERMLEIENTTKKLLSSFNLEESPCIDIVSLVEKDGFEVKTKELPLDSTGELHIRLGKRQIIVNTVFDNVENETDVIFKKSRFVTAHEYGHFILHNNGRKIANESRSRLRRTEIIELEADYFARSILMPLEQFNKFYSALKILYSSDLDQITNTLSALFNVTKNKVKSRVEDLSILN